MARRHRHHRKPPGKKPPGQPPGKPPAPAPPPSAVVATPGNEGTSVQMASGGGQAADTSNAAAQAGATGGGEESWFSTGPGVALHYQPTQTFPYYLAGVITPDTTQAGAAPAPAGGSATP